MNLASVLLAAAAVAPDRGGIRSPGGDLSAGELARDAGRFAERWNRDLTPGARVALVAPNEPALVVALLGTLAAGAIAVPLNPAAPPAELAGQLREVEPALVLASPSARAAVDLAAGEVGVRTVGLDDATGTALAGAPPRLPVDRAPTDPAVLLFTSGTAGRPRAAVLTHGSLAANLEQVQAHPAFAVRPDDVALVVLPCFHVFGLNTALALPLRAGATVSLVEGFDPSATLRRVEDDRITLLAGVPAMWAAWLDLPERDASPQAFARVRLAVSGAAPLPGAVAAGVRERFGLEILEGYGLTEASPVVSAGRPGDPPGTVGPPLPGVEVRLVDHDGGDVVAGDPGEVWVRGPSVFAGYWRDEAATRRVLDHDGWLHTGDLAVAADDGVLRLVDRAKDLVIVNGFNVYPGEVEDVLRQHPAVLEAAVVGEPDGRTGEAVVAFVVGRAEAVPSPDELAGFCATRLARYKVPTRVELVEELPRSFTGKVRRFSLRARETAAEEPATKNPA